MSERWSDIGYIKELEPNIYASHLPQDSHSSGNQPSCNFRPWEENVHRVHSEEEINVAHTLLSLSTSIVNQPPPPQPQTAIKDNMLQPPSETQPEQTPVTPVFPGTQVKAYLSNAALAMHLPKLPHICGVCGSRFSNSRLLQCHLRVHTSEKIYSCSQCEKVFADCFNIRLHVQTHTTTKNFKCPRCHKSFALKNYLNRHMRTVCFKKNGSRPTTSA